MKPGKWINVFDWGGGEYMEFRKVGPYQFQFIRITDMDDACGRDNEGQPKYAADLALVDLQAFDAKTIQSAVDCCGGNECLPEELTLDQRNERTAEMCFQYGARAPLHDCAGGSWHRLQRECRKEANAMLDSDTLATALDRPVNALGSTAAEYARGDFQSAIERGVYAGRPEAVTMAKMYRVSQTEIDDARPADWLPYVMGYMHGFGGSSKEEPASDDPEDALAPEYYLGYERGVNVKEGRATRPSWIQ